MGFLLAIVIFFIVLMVFVVWPVRMCCKWLKAGRVSMGWSFLAVFLSGIASFVAAIIAAFLAVGLGGLEVPFLILVDILAPTLVFWWILQITSFWRALGVYLLSSLVSFLMLLAVFLIVMVLSIATGIGSAHFEDLSFSKLTSAVSSGRDYVQIEEIELVAQRICDCGSDVDCRRSEAHDFKKLLSGIDASKYSDDERMQIAKIMQKAAVCIKNPSMAKSRGYVSEREASAEDEGGELSERERNVLKQRQAQAAAAKKVKYITINFRQAKKYPGRPAWIVTHDGRTHQGLLGKAGDNSLELQKMSHGGTLTSHIRKADIRQIRVMVKANKAKPN